MEQVWLWTRMSEDCFEETTLVLSKVLKVVWYGLFRPLCTLCCNVLCFLVCNLLPPSDLKDPNYRKKRLLVIYDYMILMQVFLSLISLFLSLK